MQWVQTWKKKNIKVGETRKLAHSNISGTELEPPRGEGAVPIPKRVARRERGKSRRRLGKAAQGAPGYSQRCWYEKTGKRHLKRMAASRKARPPAKQMAVLILELTSR